MVEITNDNIAEENEIFQLMLTMSKVISSNSSIYQVHNESATVTITDDDSKLNKALSDSDLVM